MYSPDYDDLGVFKLHGKTITHLSETRNPDWREWCSGCGRLIAATEKGVGYYASPEHADKVANVGMLWCHKYPIASKYLEMDDWSKWEFSNFFERVFSHIDHPSFCKDCIKELKKVGWKVCECGCGG